MRLLHGMYQTYQTVDSTRGDPFLGRSSPSLTLFNKPFAHKGLGKRSSRQAITRVNNE